MSDSLAASGAFLLPLESTGCGLGVARQAQAAARAFFDLPAEHKLAVGSPDCAGVARGYSGESHANIAFAAEGEDQPAEDSKQAFTIGTNRYQWDGGAPAADLSGEYFASESADGAFYARNRWPAGEKTLCKCSHGAFAWLGCLSLRCCPCRRARGGASLAVAGIRRGDAHPGRRAVPNLRGRARPARGCLRSNSRRAPFLRAAGGGISGGAAGGWSGRAADIAAPRLLTLLDPADGREKLQPHILRIQRKNFRSWA